MAALTTFSLWEVKGRVCAPLGRVNKRSVPQKGQQAKGLLIHNLGRASNVDMQAVALPLENRVFLMFL